MAFRRIVQVFKNIGIIAGAIASVLSIFSVFFLSHWTDPHITIVNRLAMPVVVTLNSGVTKTIAAESYITIAVDSYPLDVHYSVSNPVLYSRVMGDELRRWIHQVENGETVYVTNDNGFGKWPKYFSPAITNNTSAKCSVVVNDGWASENDPNILISPGASYQLGYYKLYTNSNIVFRCEDGRTTFFGDHPSLGRSPRLYSLTKSGSGVADVYIDPQDISFVLESFWKILPNEILFQLEK